MEKTYPASGGLGLLILLFFFVLITLLAKFIFEPLFLEFEVATRTIQALTVLWFITLSYFVFVTFFQSLNVMKNKGQLVVVKENSILVPDRDSPFLPIILKPEVELKYSEIESAFLNYVMNTTWLYIHDGKRKRLITSKMVGSRELSEISDVLKEKGVHFKD